MLYLLILCKYSDFGAKILFGCGFFVHTCSCLQKNADCAGESWGLAKICEKTIFFIIRSLNIVDNWSIFNNFVFYFAQIGRLG